MRTLFIFLFFVIIVLVWSSGKRVILISQEAINIYSLSSEGKVIGEIKKDTSLPVLKCEDVKSYINPQVLLPNGKVGYVVIGKFKLIRYSAWDFNKGKLSFSCG